MTHLNLSMNDIWDDGVALIMNVVSGSRTLIYLNLASCSLSPIGLKTVFTGLYLN